MPRPYIITLRNSQVSSQGCLLYSMTLATVLHSVKQRKQQKAVSSLHSCTAMESGSSNSPRGSGSSALEVPASPTGAALAFFACPCTSFCSPVASACLFRHNPNLLSPALGRLVAGRPCCKYRSLSCSGKVLGFSLRSSKKAKRCSHSQLLITGAPSKEAA